MPRTPMPPRPFIPAPGVMQAEMIYQVLGQTCENVYHVLQGDGATAPTIAEMNALATALVNWETASGHAVRNAACSFTTVRVRDLTTATGASVEDTVGSPIVGSGTGQIAPTNVTLAVKWKTGLGGRSFRGRTYHIGLGIAQCDGDQIRPDAEATILSVYQALETAINGVAGCTFVVLSYAHANAWRSTALATPIIQVSIDPNLDSQRRRLTGRGR